MGKLLTNVNQKRLMFLLSIAQAFLVFTVALSHSRAEPSHAFAVRLFLDLKFRAYAFAFALPRS
jgi:hypothetical protein